MQKLALTARLACALLLSSSALAGDYYVDAATGDNLNSGTSQTDAWKTISKALASIPGSTPHTVHVAPGVYDTTLGEGFPLGLRTRIDIVGTGGPEVTIIDGGGVSRLCVLPGITNSIAGPTLEGLWLRNAGVGVDFATTLIATDGTLHLRSSIISGMTDTGIRMDVDAYDDWLSGTGGYASGLVDMQQCTIFDCGQGVSVSADAMDEASATVDIMFANSLLVDCNHGLLAGAGHNSSDGITVTGSRVAGCTGTAVSSTYVNITSSVLAANGKAISALGGGATKSTLYDNELCLKGYSSSGFGFGDSVLWNNTNLFNDANPSFWYCNLSSGTAIGGNGNISQNPLFWAPGIRDYHLKAGSPCIDAGNPSSPPDPDGSIADMGAHPFDPAYVPEARSYCVAGLNSVGTKAVMGVSGSSSLATNDFTLHVTTATPNRMGLFYYGSARASIPFGDGTRCVDGGGNGLFRLGPPTMTDGAGASSRLLDFTTLPAGGGAGAVLPGSRWNFQYWYRDPGGPLGSGFNLSNGITAWFLP